MEGLDSLPSRITDCLKEYIKRDLFNCDFIGSDKEYYKRCHSRVFGILVQSILAEGFITDIERSVQFKEPYKPPERKRSQRQFTPDIVVVDGQDNIVGIVEYESIDAEEEHIYKKIDYFRLALPANPNIQFIIFFPTLTTLEQKPSSWIEKNRKKFEEPISKKLLTLSKDFPKVAVYYLTLDERGVSSKIVKNGRIENEHRENIWNLEK